MVWKRNEVMKQENRLDSDESRRFLVERAMGIEQQKFYGDTQIMERIKRK